MKYYTLNAHRSTAVSENTSGSRPQISACKTTLTRRKQLCEGSTVTEAFLHRDFAIARVSVSNSKNTTPLKYKKRLKQDKNHIYGYTTDEEQEVISNMEILKVILTSLLSAAALFLIAKIMGHKQISQLDFFDYITGITIGSIAAELATELEKPWMPLIAMIVYGVIAVFLSIVSNKYFRSRKYINGTPTIIMNNGKLYRENMKKAKLDLSEFMVMCRQEGYFNINDIQTAIFEYNGRLTILPVSDKRPLTPKDMSMTPPAEQICTEIIMDGRILEGNLKRLGLDMNWLEKQLKNQKYHSAKEIYLGLCDQNNKLSLFPVK